MIYNVQLRGQDEPFSRVYLAVEADTMTEAQEKALGEYEGRTVKEISESHLDAIIK
jgi:hypothetical protein